MSVTPDWQQRVIDEQNDLNDKVTKLETYLAGDALTRELLETQLFHMQKYLLVLNERIAGF